MRTFVALVLLVTLAGCGGDATDTPQSQNSGLAASAATAPPAATAALALAPTLVPTVKPTVVPAVKTGLGITRTDLQARFERAPFRFTFVDSSSDKGPAVKGAASSPDLAVELRGPPTDVEEAQVQTTINGTNSADALQAMVALLSATVPSIDNPTTWLQPHLDKALKEKTDVAIEGSRMITIIAAPEIKFLLLSVRAAP